VSIFAKIIIFSCAGLLFLKPVWSFFLLFAIFHANKIEVFLFYLRGDTAAIRAKIRKLLF
jgi:hypothetical protein